MLIFLTRADLAEDLKPWRRPGSDLTDYFNYGFDEFTWASYCLKQETLRKDVADQKRQMEELQNFLMPGMSGQPPPVAAAAAAVGQAAHGMPGMPPDLPPEMQQLMAGMMAQGLDPGQMDPALFMQGMGQAGQSAGFGGGQVVQGFGGQAVQQQQQQQQMGYGFDQGMGVGRGGSGGGSGGFGAGGGGGARGRGVNGRRNW